MKEGISGLPKCEYFKEINLDGKVIIVGENIVIKNIVYPVIDIQLYGKTVLVWCKDSMNKLVCFNDVEIMGERWSRR